MSPNHCIDLKAFDCSKSPTTKLNLLQALLTKARLNVKPLQNLLIHQRLISQFWPQILMPGDVHDINKHDSTTILFSTSNSAPAMSIFTTTKSCGLVFCNSHLLKSTAWTLCSSAVAFESPNMLILALSKESLPATEYTNELVTLLMSPCEASEGFLIWLEPLSEIFCNVTCSLQSNHVIDHVKLKGTACACMLCYIRNHASLCIHAVLQHNQLGAMLFKTQSVVLMQLVHV